MSIRIIFFLNFKIQTSFIIFSTILISQGLIMVDSSRGKNMQPLIDNM